MNHEDVKHSSAIFRWLVLLGMILLAAVLRIAPHPWNFTPVGAMALFAGAMLRDKRVAFAFPLAALFAGDLVIGFHKLMPAVYASFLVSVAIGLLLRKHRAVLRVGSVALLGAAQFFMVTNFAVWAVGNTYPKTGPGIVACFVAAIPFFWNTLAGDFFYSALLFGGFALAEKLFPALRVPSRQTVA